jgi:hypothetical protein
MPSNEGTPHLIEEVVMKVGRFAAQMKYSLVGALVLGGIWPVQTTAQHDHGLAAAQHQSPSPDQKKQAGAFVKLVRESTERFRDVAVAEAEGYALQFGCVSGSDAGAMGLHFVKGSLVGDDVLDPTRPEILIYEPTPSGRLRLTGADYLVFAETWHQTHTATPELMGQLLHLFESPNRFGLPAFYTLHVWAWKDNPNGTFVNWHPDVSCDGFAGQNP